MPKGFGPDSFLQHSFLRVLMWQVDNRLLSARYGNFVNGIQVDFNNNELIRLYLLLCDLEPVIARQSSQYRESLSRAKEIILFVLPPDVSRQLKVIGTEIQPDAFASLSREAERYPGWQDYYYAHAIRAGTGRVSRRELDKVIDKVSDKELRLALRDYVLFAAVNEKLMFGDLPEAAHLASDIQQPALQGLAFYSAAISDPVVKSGGSYVFELLLRAETAARSSADEHEKAMILMSVAAAYARLDRQRAFESLRESVAALNRAEKPELAPVVFVRSLRASGLEIRLRYLYTGFAVEDAFIKLRDLDFEETVYAARNLEDKGLRARVLLMLSAVCLSKPDPAAKKEKAVIATASPQP